MNNVHRLPTANAQAAHRILRAKIKVSTIIETVAEFYDLPPDAMTICSKRKRRPTLYLSHCRQVAIYIARKMTGQSLPALGGRFGGLHHTSIIHAIRAVEQRMEEDPELRLDVEQLMRAIGR